MKKQFNKVIQATCLMAILCLASCSKNLDLVVPGDGNEAYINFTNASEALLSSDPDDRLAYGNMVYINDSIPNDTYSNYPKFADGQFQEFKTHPRFPSGTDYGNATGDIQVPAGSNYSLVFWMPIASGNNKLIYTSGNKVYLKETTVNLAPKSFTMQYLVESPEADDAYQVVNVPAELKGIPGKVRIQVINLSPDLGKIEVIRTAKDGSLISSDLPANLEFSNYSSYAELDTVGSSVANGYIFLKIKKSGENTTLFTTTVPAIPGSSFCILVRGFNQQAVRRLKYSNSEYRTVTVQPNLRIFNKRIF